jgi:hypothetical protein
MTRCEDQNHQPQALTALLAGQNGLDGQGGQG